MRGTLPQWDRPDLRSEGLPCVAGRPVRVLPCCFVVQAHPISFRPQVQICDTPISIRDSGPFSRLRSLRRVQLATWSHPTFWDALSGFWTPDLTSGMPRS